MQNPLSPAAAELDLLREVGRIEVVANTTADLSVWNELVATGFAKVGPLGRPLITLFLAEEAPTPATQATPPPPNGIAYDDYDQMIRLVASRFGDRVFEIFQKEFQSCADFAERNSDTLNCQGYNFLASVAHTARQTVEAQAANYQLEEELCRRRAVVLNHEMAACHYEISDPREAARHVSSAAHEKRKIDELEAKRAAVSTS